MDDIADVTDYSEDSSALNQNEKLEREFDFEEFCKNIKKCVFKEALSTDDVELKYYLLAYEQLYNFFLLLGGAFQFVASDVKNKIEILNKFQNEELTKNEKLIYFSTVKSMVNHEIESNLLKDSKYVSGSRTLLRLHRGLDFIRKFLKAIYDAENNEKLGVIARETYDKTLAEYHSWIIKTSARVAMQFLPTRAELLNKISKNNEDKLNQMLNLLPEAFDSMNQKGYISIFYLISISRYV
ncbi:glycolipid transfer protein, putative [Pediculus humanus corporis]|uniref:Glycolipid transfer protein, putative n=1 Tax=Pediculus humanus subsp. corporis TaxID=121224 RepID=E0VSR8_PEDHC|nr:glycolipid transfer protein, putative [Pediculus humanus corporis]EEB16424.1 glycolipid transfer protein, putative [Pediculus humanus corporis]